MRALLLALLLLLVACTPEVLAPEVPPVAVDCYDVDLGHYIPCPEGV